MIPKMVRGTHILISCFDDSRLRDARNASFLSGAGMAVLTGSSTAGALRRLPLRSCSRRFGPVSGLAMPSMPMSGLVPVRQTVRPRSIRE
jgi:hypothetical protein